MSRVRTDSTLIYLNLQQRAVYNKGGLAWDERPQPGVPTCKGQGQVINHKNVKLSVRVPMNVGGGYDSICMGSTRSYLWNTMAALSREAFRNTFRWIGLPGLLHGFLSQAGRSGEIRVHAEGFLRLFWYAPALFFYDEQSSSSLKVRPLAPALYAAWTRREFVPI